MRTYWICGLLLITGTAHATEPSPPAPTKLAQALLFHASFDETADADSASGDGRIYTAKSLKREDVEAGLLSPGVRLDRKAGRHGGALVFTKKTEQVIFYKGVGNLPPTTGAFAGTVSFWLRLTPAIDLPPGYVDPIQITDKKWNDASLFVDFTKDSPRKFRLGIFSDYAFWNPQDRNWDAIPDKERPLVTVDKPPFARDQWTHVGITFRDFNSGQSTGVATLYLNGDSQGQLSRKQQITWGEERLAIMLGIYYVGKLDDFAVFNRALSGEEIKHIFQLPQGIKTLSGANP